MPITSPSTSLYQLGRGILEIAPWADADNEPTYSSDFVDVGNCPKFEVEVTEEKLDHYSHRSGLKVKDKSVTLEIGYNINFDLDEISVANIAKYLRGTMTGSDVIHAAQALDTEFALRFTTDNPAGEDQIWKFWRASLKPGGTFNLISDEWGLMSFTAEGLSAVTQHGDSPYFDVQWVTTTT
jgi:hypothetical protein